MGVGWVVFGIVKTCSDGALDVKNIMRVFFVFLEPHAWFCTEVKCHAEEMNSTCHSYGLGEKLWAFAVRNINAVVYFMLYFK